MTRRTRAVVGLAGLVVSAGLTGCGDDQPAAKPLAPASTAGQATAAFNPCSDLTPDFVGQALGAEVTEDTGSTSAPRCAYTPVVEGGPALEVNYLQFSGSFDEAWASMGAIAGTTRDLDIASADAARIVVNADGNAVAVTGFVQTGDLIENVNGVQLAPYDQDALVAATEAVLTRLSKKAAARD